MPQVVSELSLICSKISKNILSDIYMYVFAHICTYIIIYTHIYIDMIHTYTHVFAHIHNHTYRHIHRYDTYIHTYQYLDDRQMIHVWSMWCDTYHINEVMPLQLTIHKSHRLFIRGYEKSFKFLVRFSKRLPGQYTGYCCHPCLPPRGWRLITFAEETTFFIHRTWKIWAGSVLKAPEV